MNNFALFICGAIVALISGLGIIIYTVSLGYDKKEKKSVEFDIDLGAAKPEVFIDPVSSVQTPSVL